MLHEFLSANRAAIIARTRAKVAARPAPRATEEELENGIPLFLDQLISTLAHSHIPSNALRESATEHGRAGYAKYRHDFARLIWKTASPQWNFSDAEFDRSAASFDNPDHVDVVIHNYRWRQSLAEGEARYDDLERRLAAGPTIAVPTIVLEGDANGAPHATGDAAFRKKFTGSYNYRVITGGIGHNLPQEAPREFAQAVLDVAALGA